MGTVFLTHSVDKLDITFHIVRLILNILLLSTIAVIEIEIKNFYM